MCVLWASDLNKALFESDPICYALFKAPQTFNGSQLCIVALETLGVSTCCLQILKGTFLMSQSFGTDEPDLEPHEKTWCSPCIDKVGRNGKDKTTV